MKAKEMRDLSDDEIERMLGEAREAYFNLRFQHATGSLERVSELSARRREIARLLTIAREREMTA
jgi:large subunit ribosomal protein L29